MSVGIDEDQEASFWYGRHRPNKVEILRDKIHDRLTSLGFTLDHGSRSGSRYYDHPDHPDHDGAPVRVSDHSLDKHWNPSFIYRDESVSGLLPHPTVMDDLEEFLGDLHRKTKESLDKKKKYNETFFPDHPHVVGDATMKLINNFKPK